MHTNEGSKKSIKTKVVTQVSTFIAFILMIAFGFIAYLSIVNFQARAKLSLEHKTNKVFNILEQRLEYLQENTELLAKNELLINAYIDQSDRDQYLPALIENFKEGKYLTLFSLVDFNGRVIFQSHNAPINITQEVNLALNLAKTVTLFSLETQSLLIIVPIKYYGATQGAIIAAYDIKTLIALYSQANRDFVTKLFYKQTLFFSNYSDHEYYTYLATPKAEHTILKNLDFSLEMGIEKSSYLAPLKRQLFYLGLLALSILALGTWVSLYLATSITSPILKLYRKVKQISTEVNKREYTPLGTQDELESLGYAFYDKTKEIDELNASLHSKVMEQLRLMEVAINNVKDAIYLADESGALIYVNEGASFQLGHTLEELLSMSVFDVDTKVDQLQWRHIWQELQKIGHKKMESIHQRKNDTTFEVEIDAYFIIYNNQGYNLGLVRDVSERNALQNALKEERNRFALAVEGAQDGLWDWNLLSDEVYLTPRFETMLGYEVGELPQNVDAWFALLHPEDKAKTMHAVQKYLQGRGDDNFQAQFRLRNQDSSWRWIMGRGKAQFDDNGKAIRFVGFNTDITEQIEYNEKLDYTAKHDLLTHLPNRVLFTELLMQAMHGCDRHNNNLALLFIDLDGFKDINDKYGHDVGDKVLSVVAKRMKDILRSSDVVARLGGDEFVIIVTDLKNQNEVAPTLNRLLETLGASFQIAQTSLQVSASIGVSFYPQSEEVGTEVLLRQADQAMYSAKLAGKNQYQFFNIEAMQGLKEQQLFVQSLRSAIQNDELVLHYQPKMDMLNNRVIGFEVLLRWMHPERGMLYPDSFLDIVASDATIIKDIGEWVFENAFMQLNHWLEEGLSLELSINVSSYEIQQKNFIPFLEALLRRHPNVEPHMIQLELLETAAFDNFEYTQITLRQCKALGFSIAIDDFGTGYASLSYLKQLPVDTLKIDKSFVIDLLETTTSLSIVEASIGLARAFGYNVIAEGVESEEHGKVLLQLGCLMAQGYAINRAMPATSVKNWLDEWKGYPLWQSIKPLDTPALTLLYTSIEHRNWVRTIEMYLLGKTNDLPSLKSSKCHLGHWIREYATPQQRKHPEFRQLSQMHEELHTYAETLLHTTKEEYSMDIEHLKKSRNSILKKLEILLHVG